MKLSLLVLFSACVFAQAPPVCTSAGAPAGGSAADATTPAITTPSNTSLILIAPTDYGFFVDSDTVRDNKGNIYHPVSPFAGGSTNTDVGFWYSFDHGGTPLSVGAGHTFTVRGSYTGFTVCAFSGTYSGGDPWVSTQHNGGSGAAVTTVQPGSLTPAASPALVLTTMGADAAVTPSINSGFTISRTQGYVSGQNMYNAIAYLVQPTAAAVNPTWTTDISADLTASITSFKMDPLSSGPSSYSLATPFDTATATGVIGGTITAPMAFDGGSTITITLSDGTHTASTTLTPTGSTMVRWTITVPSTVGTYTLSATHTGAAITDPASQSMPVVAVLSTATLQTNYLSLKCGGFFWMGPSTFQGIQWATPNLAVDSMWAPTGLNMDQWLDAVVSAGCKYATIVTKHHDGFSIWNTDTSVPTFSPYSVAQSTWYATHQMDVVEQFCVKARARNLKVILYFSIPDRTYEIRSGTTSITGTSAYVAWIEAQMQELLTRYGNIAGWETDGWQWSGDPTGAPGSDVAVGGYLHITFAPIYNYLKAIQPNCLFIENDHTQTHGDIAVYEQPVTSVVPNLNTVPAVQWGPIRYDVDWAYNAGDHQDGSVVRSQRKIAEEYKYLSTRFANHELALTPTTAGVIPPDQITAYTTWRRELIYTTNLAAGKTVTASSTLSGFNDLTKLTDGVLATASGNLVASNTGDTTPYFEVDLGSATTVGNIEVFPRTDGPFTSSGRFRDIVLRAYDATHAQVFQSGVLNPGNAQYSGSFTLGVGQLGATFVPLNARYVRVSRNTTSSSDDGAQLAVMEIQAFAESDESPITNFQIDTTSSTQAVLSYTAPSSSACTLQIADMGRGTTITSATQASGTVTVTTRTAHGLLTGQTVYLENTTLWDGWQTPITVLSATSFTFPSATTGSAAAGNVGLLVDDVNPALFTGANADDRANNVNDGTSRHFVIGKKSGAELALDGNRYSRILTPATRYRHDLTCDTSTLSGFFTTPTLPAGALWNDPPPVDRSHPGTLATPTVQWANPGQQFLDQITGVRMRRGAKITPAASAVTDFGTARDANAVWTIGGTPPTLSGGSATFVGGVGGCAAGGCPLLLRADNFGITNALSLDATYGDSYNNTQDLSYATVALTGSLSNGACTGSNAIPNCQVNACLTYDGVSCGTPLKVCTLNSTLTTCNLGSATHGDLWQTSGDAKVNRANSTKAFGFMDYTASTKAAVITSVLCGTVASSTSCFSTEWSPGSQIFIAGTPYTIASIQSERKLTLVAGPGTDLSAAAWHANNFGVLISKTSATADTLTINHTTFQYGAAADDFFPTFSLDCFSHVKLTLDGNPGHQGFIGRDLYWVSDDGTDIRDLGPIGTTFGSIGMFSEGAIAGMSDKPEQFDPELPDIWYFMTRVSFTYWTLTKAQYFGDHKTPAPSHLTSSGFLPDCAQPGVTQPCVAFTPMTLTASPVQAVSEAFAPVYASSGSNPGPAVWYFEGIDSAKHVFFRETLGNQNTQAWYFVWDLADRGVYDGTSAHFHPIAAANDFSTPPNRWAGNHGGTRFTWEKPGLVATAEDSYGPSSPTNVSWNMTATSPISATLTTCPTNPLGVTGVQCTAVVTTSGPFLKPGSRTPEINTMPLMVGDTYRNENEYFRVVQLTDQQHHVAERGYNNTTVVSHTDTDLVMISGCIPVDGAANNCVWDFVADPMGTNTTGATIFNYKMTNGGHAGSGPGFDVQMGSAWYTPVFGAYCPKYNGQLQICSLSTFGDTYLDRNNAVFGVTQFFQAMNPPFGGQGQRGSAWATDNHPGPCFGKTWCLDAKPLFGDDNPSSDSALWTKTLGTASAPFTLVSGQLWKFPGSDSFIHRKLFPTMAYVGRKGLVDVSGQSSLIPTDSTGSYTYCHVVIAGECRPGSAVGDVFVNAPFVSDAFCSAPGTAQDQGNMQHICIGDSVPLRGEVVQLGLTQQDFTARNSRGLGTLLATYNTHATYWNTSMNFAGTVAVQQTRWLGNLRHVNMLVSLPPYAAWDGKMRDQFMPVTVTLPAVAGSTNAIVEFGYAENGNQFYCTSRQETCIAVNSGSAVNLTTPYYFAAESYSGVACSSGCSISIPGVSGKVLYYRVKRRDSGNTVVSTEKPQLVVVP